MAWKNDKIKDSIIEDQMEEYLLYFILLAAGIAFTKSIITTNGTLLVDRQEEILNNRLHKINIRAV